MQKLIILSLASTLLLSSCNSKPKATSTSLQKEAEAFLADYNKQYQKFLTASNEGQWKLNTHIVEGDTATSGAAARADEALAKFTGSKAITDIAQKFLEVKDSLTPLQVRQLNYIMFNAGANPEAAGDLVKKKTGRSAQAYIQNKVIDVAKERIFDESKSVSQIAYDLGFKYPQHFTRLFKQRVGQSPNEYRMLN